MVGLLPDKSRRATEGLRFATAAVAYAFFNQGAGWSQNVRFAQARAIAEEGRLPVDSFLVYRAAGPEAGSDHFARERVTDGMCVVDGREFALAWRDNHG